MEPNGAVRNGRHILNGWFLNHAKDFVAVLALTAMIAGGMNHFATAADVEKKFKSLQVELKVAGLEARRTRVEDELFRLRSEGKTDPGTRAQIARFESELRDVTQRLRDLEKDR